MKTTDLSLEEIYNLALKTLKFNGGEELNAKAVANTVTNAERDGSISHGLFRIPGYIAALKSGGKGKGNRKVAKDFDWLYVLDADNNEYIIDSLGRDLESSNIEEN